MALACLNELPVKSSLLADWGWFFLLVMLQVMSQSE